jgi:hypothetical protein
MRMMLKFTLPVDRGNVAFNDGSLGRTIEQVISKLKPEAAYFAPMEASTRVCYFSTWPSHRRLSKLLSRSFVISMPRPSWFLS